MKSRWIIGAAIACVVAATPIAAQSLSPSSAVDDAGATGERTVVWTADDAIQPRSLGAGQTSAEFVLLPTGCRIFDTRSTAGGPIAASGSRDFSVLNASVPAQGGKAGGCAIPADAVAVQMTLSTVSGSPTAVGGLRLGPGGAAPTATVLQFAKSQGTSAAATAGLSVTSTIRVAAFGGATHVIGDVTGYYRKVLKATVNANGTVALQSGVATSSIFGDPDVTGFYIVEFERDVSECVPVVTPLTSSSTVRVSAILNGPSGREVFVLVRGYNDTIATAGAFQLTMSC